MTVFLFEMAGMIFQGETLTCKYLGLKNIRCHIYHSKACGSSCRRHQNRFSVPEKDERHFDKLSERIQQGDLTNYNVRGHLTQPS